jgi:hypothetical protein
MHDRPSGDRQRCYAFPSGGAVEITCPGRRRERHSAGAGECARAQRLGQRSERHRQCGQGACDTAADNRSGAPANRISSCQLRIASCRLSRGTGGASRKDATTAIQVIEIAWKGSSRGREEAAQTARPQNDEHLQGMLSSPADATSYRSKLTAIIPDSRKVSPGMSALCG